MLLPFCVCMQIADKAAIRGTSNKDMPKKKIP